MTNNLLCKWALAILIGMTTTFSFAAGVKLSNDDGYVKLGGRIQLQYYQEDPDGGDSADDLFFRRFRPYIEGSIHDDWKGKFQIDFGKGDTEIKDAYLEYEGLDYMDVQLGNTVVPFSRERWTSSKKQQLVERTFAGDHNYGVPDRSVGLHLNNAEDMFNWGVAAVMAAHDPDNKKMDFDSPVSLKRGDDWTEGPMLSGRLEWTPLGKIKYDQTDFGYSDLKVGLGVSAFTWSNDDDFRNEISVDDDGTRSLGKQDLDEATGFGVSASTRYKGLSADVEYNAVDGDLVDAGVTSGLYQDSSTTLESLSFEIGYLVAGNTEVIYGYEQLDADNYNTEWTRNSIGLNHYIKKHDIKLSGAYRINEDKDGSEGKDVDELFIQAQYVF